MTRRRTEPRGIRAAAVLAHGMSRHAFRDPLPVAAVAPRLVSHETVRHAAHDEGGRGGHDLEQWVIAAPQQPTRVQVAALGVAADASWHSGHVAEGEQRWTYTARRPLSAGSCQRCALHGVAPHQRAGQRSGLSLDQLEDLARGAIDAGDRAAVTILGLAMVPARMCWTAKPIEIHAMAHAIDAWVGRCRRTGGRPWMRSVNDQKAERLCPGCEACRGGCEPSPTATTTAV